MTTPFGMAAVPVRPIIRVAGATPAFALAQSLTWTWRPALDLAGNRTVPIHALRRVMEAWAVLVPSPRGVRMRSAQIPVADDLADDMAHPRGRPRRLSAEWSLPRDPRPGAILYLHGGGFVVGSARTHRLISGRLAADTGLAVLTPDYRLAPEHPFPAAFEDALAAYRYLLASDVPPSRIIIAGDSAGGHLAAGLVAHARALGLPLPAGTLLLSPWLDLDCATARQADRRHRDPFVSPDAAQRLAGLYIGEHDRADSRLHPLLCGQGPLPPFLIQVGGREAMGDDARNLAESLAEADIPCRLQVWPGQIHVFQVMHHWLPAARAAMRQAAAFAIECVERAEDDIHAGSLREPAEI